MPNIEIDFDVFKQLTALRPAEEVTYNDVIRKLLDMPFASQPAHYTSEKSWVVGDTSFPVGTEFRADYKGTVHTGRVVDGKLLLDDGLKFTTPSAAAVHITGSNVNGWRFWKCKLPGTANFVLLERLRGKAHELFM